MVNVLEKLTKLEELRPTVTISDEGGLSPGTSPEEPNHYFILWAQNQKIRQLIQDVTFLRTVLKLLAPGSSFLVGVCQTPSIFYIFCSIPSSTGFNFEGFFPTEFYALLILQHPGAVLSQFHIRAAFTNQKDFLVERDSLIKTYKLSLVDLDSPLPPSLSN